MQKFGTGQSVKRVEDQRFLRGAGQYVDDLRPEGALRAFFLRAPVAHAEITALDVTDAENAEGVHLVLTADRLAAAGVAHALYAALVNNQDGSPGANPRRPVLAEDRVRFVGEAVALILAETLDQARDAAELIEVDYDELDVHVALAVGGPQIHADAPENRAFDWAFGDKAAVDAVFDNAAHVVRASVADNRIMVASMEPRGVTAEMRDGRLLVTNNGQGVWGPKRRIAEQLGMAPEDIQVVNPDVGGGFGMKAMDYPEMMAVAQAARMVDRPVHWMSERTEAMLSDNGGRDLVTEAELAFDADHKLIGYRNHTVANMGAYNSQFAQNIQTNLALKVIGGVYDLQAIWFQVEGVFTNTTPVDAYRGAGRPEAIYVIERAMDYAARELGVDALVLRAKNMIPAAAFPYVLPCGEEVDVGDFQRVMERARQETDLAGFAARQAESAAEGKLRGVGHCYYIEAILGDPAETARVVYEADGTVSFYVGTQSNGQGHETVYRQLLSEFTGIDPEAVRIVEGDSDRIAVGGGTGGSRSVTTQGTATRAMAGDMIAAFQPFISGLLDGEAVFEDGRFGAPGSNRTFSLIEAAEAARAAGRVDLLDHSTRAQLSSRSYPNGMHVAEVEIDPETGVTQVVRYGIVDDFGVLMNPMLAEGQVHGGVAQGIGQALSERVVFDDEGQLLTASFMDYAVPRAVDIPMMTFATEPVPSTANPLGMKGCGEAGTIGALAAVSNAVQDAVADLGIPRMDMPFTPLSVWQQVQDARKAG